MVVQAPSTPRVIRHESEHDRWEFVFGERDPRLRPYVVHCCCYAEETTTFTRRIEAPGLRAPLIFNFGPPVAVRALRRARVRPLLDLLRETSRGASGTSAPLALKVCSSMSSR